MSLASAAANMVVPLPRASHGWIPSAWLELFALGEGCCHKATPRPLCVSTVALGSGKPIGRSSVVPQVTGDQLSDRLLSLEYPVHLEVLSTIAGIWAMRRMGLTVGLAAHPWGVDGYESCGPS